MKHKLIICPARFNMHRILIGLLVAGAIILGHGNVHAYTAFITFDRKELKRWIDREAIKSSISEDAESLSITTSLPEAESSELKWEMRLEVRDGTNGVVSVEIEGRKTASVKKEKRFVSFSFRISQKYISNSKVVFWEAWTPKNHPETGGVGAVYEIKLSDLQETVKVSKQP